MGASLIQVAPECHDMVWCSWLGSIFIKAIGRKRKLEMVVPYLIYVVRVELCRVAGSLGFLHRRDGNYALLSKSWT
jgi:hypothetical protein